MFNFEKRILKNGLRVVAVPMKNMDAVTISALVGVGSKNENKKTNGVSHFLEHLFFKGTKKRPNAGDISRELDSIGAEHNAFTSKEITGFWVKSSVKNFNFDMDIVSDILINPLFKKEEIEKERGVILQELSMYEDLPQHKVSDVLSKVMYGDNPAGWGIAGSKETVKNIKESDILNHRKNNYFSQNIVLIVTGGINKKDIFKKSEEFFGNIKKGKTRGFKKSSMVQKNPQVHFLNKKTDQSHLAMGLRAYDMFDDRRYALEILSIILGGNSSSRLFTEIREKLGLAYYVGSGVERQKDLGFLGVRVGVAHDTLDLTIKKISEIFSDLKNNGVSKGELSNAISYFKGKMALALETTDEVADFIGEQEIFYNKIMQPSDILKKIEKISQNDILKVARDIIRSDKINMAVIGDYDNSNKYKDSFVKIFSKI